MPDQQPVNEPIPIVREYSRLDALQSISVGLPGRRHGLLHCITPDGERVTRVTADMEYWEMLVAASKTPGALANMQVPPGVFPLQRRGWPDEWEWNAPLGHKVVDKWDAN